jgi:hypothetical protein
MKMRGMVINPDSITVSGNAWGTALPELVFNTYKDGKITRRVRVPVRPVDLEDLARALWELHAKYQKAADDVKRQLLAGNS